MKASPLETGLVFLRLGCTSFGGPIAHLGYFQREIVERRGWCSQAVFAEMVALAQALPGPTSSQVGVALGMLRAGWPGGIAAWVGFTLPSALLMFALALGHPLTAGSNGQAISHGLQLAAVAVVAQAIATMQRTLAPDWLRIALALAAAAITLVAPPFLGSALAMVCGAIAGLVLLKPKEPGPDAERTMPVTRPVAVCAAAVFAALLVVAVLPASSTASPGALFSAFYRSGALVFGGGHVVLPLLEQTVVQPGWVSQPAFLSGYGAAQTLPGPLFSIAAYLGASAQPASHPVLNGLIALIAIFLPGMLLLTAALPFWLAMRRNRQFSAALAGVNASVVGVLLAALIRPLAVATMRSPADVVIALAGFAMLFWWRLSSWLVVAFAVGAALAIAWAGHLL